MNIFELIKSGYSIAYRYGLDDVAKEVGGPKDRVDFEVLCAQKIVAAMAEREVEAPIDVDICGKEELVLVGKTNEKETAEFLGGLAYNEYGYALIGKRLVVTGWNDTTTELAVDEVIRHITEGADVPERCVCAFDGWYVDFPEPALKVGYINDQNAGHLLAYYPDATLADFLAYRQKLEGEGFVLYDENDIEGNVSATYTSKKGKIHTYFVPVECAIRVVTCLDGGYNLPSLEPIPTEKKSDCYMTQLGMAYKEGNFGSGYFLTLEDGSFIVVDGGGDKAEDYEKFYRAMKRLTREADGKIRVAAWILTHMHWDHTANFVRFCREHRDEVELEAMYCNVASRACVYNAYDPPLPHVHFNEIPELFPDMKKYIIHTGMKFYIRNVLVDVFYTQDDHFPEIVHYYNDTSAVVRLAIGGQTVTFLGDARYAASKVICERYTKALKSDIVQVSHHGFDGCTTGVYDRIDPTVCFWPTSKSHYKVMASGSMHELYFVDTRLHYEMRVHTHIPADPTQTIKLPYNKGDEIVEEE
jgi:glyoxylase-like metal-dependent hydrolase (beta-lactamase superfamily II)